MKAHHNFTIAQYLLHRLQELGAHHLFAVCGDFLLGFLDQVLKSSVQLINCCNELNAGYAADGYARIRGLGVVATTFTVGELSAINALAGSFAEYVPTVMISGSPERRHQKSGKMLHHTLGNYNIAREMYQKITVACELLEDPKKAPEQIDRAFQKCLYYKRPIYFQLPADMVTESCSSPQIFQLDKKTSDEATFKAALTQTLALLSKAKKPLILLGLEINRHHLESVTKKLIEKTNFPFSTFTTAKSTLSETHPLFIGVYKGNWSSESINHIIEESDCILMLGGFFIDSDTGGFTAKLDTHKLIKVNFDTVTIKDDVYKQVLLSPFIDALFKAIPPNSSSWVSHLKKKISLDPIQPANDTPLTVKKFFTRIQRFLKPKDIILADVGDCLYSLGETQLPSDVTFISQAFYNSIGYTVGGTLGASLAGKKRRVLLFVGDGSFQVTCQEISTMLRYGLKPILFLLNNHGYAIERAIHDNRDPNSYNDLQPWQYHLIPEVFKGKKGRMVKTELELETALSKMENNEDELHFIEVCVGKYDFGRILKLAGKAMAESSKKSYDAN